MLWSQSDQKPSWFIDWSFVAYVTRCCPNELWVRQSQAQSCYSDHWWDLLVAWNIPHKLTFSAVNLIKNLLSLLISGLWHMLQGTARMSFGFIKAKLSWAIITFVALLIVALFLIPGIRRPLLGILGFGPKGIVKGNKIRLFSMSRSLTILGFRICCCMATGGRYYEGKLVCRTPICGDENGPVMSEARHFLNLTAL